MLKWVEADPSANGRNGSEAANRAMARMGGKLTLSRSSSERSSQADFGSQALLMVQHYSRVVARDCQAQRGSEAPQVPVALVDAEIALQEPVPALFAERRKRTVAYLAREIDAELRAQAPADLPENANPEPLPPEGLP